MAFQLADRVQETTTTTGTGTLTLGGAVAGYQAFSAIMANGDTTIYAIGPDSANAWEVGLGTWGTGGLLTRTTILASSNSGSAVSFAAGSKNIWGDVAAVLALEGRLTFRLNGIVSNSLICTMPINSILWSGAMRETAGHAVNMSLGTTSGGVDVLAATALGASPATGLIMPEPGSFLKNWISTSATQALYVNSGSFGSASVNAMVTLVMAP